MGAQAPSPITTQVSSSEEAKKSDYRTTENITICDIRYQRANINMYSGLFLDLNMIYMSLPETYGSRCNRRKLKIQRQTTPRSNPRTKAQDSPFKA